MKGLSVEEKAKRYDEAIKVAKSNYETIVQMDNDCTFAKEGIVNTFHHIFPELKESEGDKELSEILGRVIRRYINDPNIPYTEREKVSMEIIPYVERLEKQGNLMKALQISNARIGELVEKNYYLREQLEKRGNNMGISEATKQELEENLNKALEQETPESCNEFLDKQGEQKPVEEYNITGIGSKNATGKLGEMIKKKLEMEKQGEQKPFFGTKTPEESLGIDSETYNKIVDECVYGEQKLTDKIESRQEELTEFEKAVKQVMEEAIECGDTHNLKADADMLLRLVQKPWSEEDNEIIETICKEGDLKPSERVWLKSLKDRVQPQQEWSEEDIAILDSAIAFVEHSAFTTIGKDKGNVVAWLKSIKDRVQPKQEWSEEDEKILNLIIARLHSHPNVEAEEYGKDYHWLKFLKERYTWKPSDEQIMALRFVLNHMPYDSHKEEISGLLEQLKKLSEE